MGRLTPEVFNDSCCDGGGTDSGDHCQPCGCDSGAGWVCAVHRREQKDVLRDLAEDMDCSIDALVEYACESVGTPYQAEERLRHPDQVGTGGEPVVYGRKGKKLGKLKAHLRDVVQKTWNFAGRLETARDHEMNAVIGLAAEAGEVLDTCKKAWFHAEKGPGHYRKDLVNELGDVYYYLLKTQDVFGISTKEILAANREKLESRHPELQQVTERFPDGYIR